MSKSCWVRLMEIQHRAEVYSGSGAGVVSPVAARSVCVRQQTVLAHETDFGSSSPG
jgi:hypothetical protein